MKGKILVLTLSAFIAGAFYSSQAAIAHTSTVKIQTATEKEDWMAFKKEQEEKIRKNDVRIQELKKAKAADGKVMDAAYQKEIERLQQRNAELRTKIVNYKFDESKWAQFKREFNHDMDELGKSIKDIGKNNVK